MKLKLQTMSGNFNFSYGASRPDSSQSRQRGKELFVDLPSKQIQDEPNFIDLLNQPKPIPLRDNFVNPQVSQNDKDHYQPK